MQAKIYPERDASSFRSCQILLLNQKVNPVAKEIQLNQPDSPTGKGLSTPRPNLTQQQG